MKILVQNSVARRLNSVVSNPASGVLNYCTYSMPFSSSYSEFVEILLEGKELVGPGNKGLSSADNLGHAPFPLGRGPETRVVGNGRRGRITGLDGLDISPAGSLLFLARASWTVSVVGIGLHEGFADSSRLILVLLANGRILRMPAFSKNDRYCN